MKQIVWSVVGRITDLEGFKTLTQKVIEEAHKEDGTLIYWWTISPDGKTFCDFDCYIDEAAALSHIKMWSRFAAEFDKYAINDKCTIYGDCSDELRQALAGLFPKQLSFYGGFLKPAPQSKVSDNSDIFWALNGKITDWEKYHASMEVLTSHTKNEAGSLMHWWSVDSASGEFHVLERYADERAASLHLETWAKYGGLFLEATDIASFTTYSSLSRETAKAVEGLNPIRMIFHGGFTR